MNNSKQEISAGGVVLNQKGEVAVVQQSNSEGWVSWCLPKGHVDEGEDILTAAKRETYEETGINDLELIKPLGRYQRYHMGYGGVDDKTRPKTIYFFLFTTKQIKLKPIDPHNPSAKWVKIKDVPNLLTHQKDKAFFRSILDSVDNM